MKQLYQKLTCFAIVVIGLMSFTTIQAQSITVSGTVTDFNGQPLPAVNVIEKGTNNGAVTDVNGNYSVTLPGDAILVFSSIGFVKEEVPVNGRTTIDMTLAEDIQSLSEVVVIGYGTQEKEDVTGSVGAIEEEDFNKGAMVSPQDLIVGRLPGVQVTTNGGAPGSGSTIRIRGGSSLSASNDPLIVVDGVPLGESGIAGMRNPLSTINPNDIESFTVLKDASAAAIYGSRAANGVIMITTKSGGKDAPLSISYDGNVSIYTVPNTADVLSSDEYRELINNQVSFGNIPDDALDLLGNENTDWQDEIYDTAIGTEHNVSLSGSKFDTPFRLSFNYSNQDGILRTSNFERKAIGANFDPSLLDDHLKFDINFKSSWVDNRFANQGAIGSAVTFDPTQPVRVSDGQWGGYYYWQQPSNPSRPITIAPTNPVALLEQTNNSAAVNRITTNANITYKFHFLPELKANLNLGLDRSKTDGTEFVSADASYAIDDEFGNGTTNNYEGETRDEILEFYLNYTKDLESIDSKIEVLGGYSYQHFYNENSNTVYDATEENVKDSLRIDKSEAFLISFYGRLNYTLKDRYVFTATYRRDGSSRFSEENRWGNFLSGAFAWKIDQEDFLVDNETISQLKLRLGYGEIGQQNVLSRYPALARVTTSGPRARYQLGNEFYRTTRFEGYDANLKWEETATWNAGIDFGFLEDRITGSLDFYYKESTDLLNSIPIPQGTNFTNELLTNIGSLENRGVELAVNAVVVNTGKFRWDAGVNFTYNDNEITNLTAVDNPDYLGVFVGGIGGGVGNTVQIHSTGHPRNTFFVYEQVYNNSGVPIEGLYVDQNGDGIINDLDRIRREDPAPDAYFGFSSMLNYKNLTFSFNARMNIGNHVYNNVASQYGQLANVYNSTGYLNNVSPYFYESGFLQPQYLSSFYLEDASFFRMDNMTLSYDFGNLISDKLGMYANFTVQNAFVITKYSGLDPEVDGGIDNNFYPRPRTFLIGIGVNL
ncbi:SusC/RagA family TonB-linked outer membrane protein [Mangrovivirga cuniculi]|uniref:SusC/RagA family protein n=1 Tax=Mangrovivirga cuniculi TaxID=2715131 RepID=A0A4D7JZ20_9BACT|nr:TonB-dependent receptor [Mangrovivirga cuniculi]QCK15955.1 SusC/RagA family protein [Mangrovivirga cuniculi]